METYPRRLRTQSGPQAPGAGGCADEQLVPARAGTPRDGSWELDALPVPALCRPLSETQSRRCCRGTSRTGSGRTGTTVTGCTTWRPHLTEVGRECPPGLPRPHPARYPGRRDRHATGRSGALFRPRRWRSGITVRRGSRGGTAAAAPRNWRWPSCSTGPATRAGRPVTIRRSGATWWPVGPGRGMGRSRWRGSAPVEAVDAWLGERK